MKAAHTPGPWTVKAGHPTLVEGAPPVGTQFTGRPVVCNVGGTKPNDAANAALIAAAPGLLDVCRHLVEIHNQNNAGPDAEARFRQVAIEARAAIAKARGES